MSYRPIRASDLDEIMVIERGCFVYPWSMRFFLEELRVQCARSVLAEVNGRILGYILFWWVAGEVDIHNLAVRREFRRRGIGRSLLQRVIDEARHQRARRVTLEVRRSNEPAQRLYESMGFLRTGVRRGYYSDDGEDALTMALELIPGERPKVGSL